MMTDEEAQDITEYRTNWSQVMLGPDHPETAVVVGTDGQSHLHIDVFLKHRLADSSTLPPNEITLAQLNELAEYYDGKRLTTNFEAIFVCSENELPDFIAANRILVKTKRFSFRSTSGSYDISGAPLTKIRWREVKDEGDVGFELRLSQIRDVEVREVYLQDALERMLDSRDLIL